MNAKDYIIQLFVKFKLILITIGFILLILKGIELTHMRITAVFTELEPFKNLPVYYKGFKIGQAVKVTPSKDFQTSRVKIILNSWHYNLPNNIKAIVQKQKDSDDNYMEILYPNAPSIRRIKYGDVIEGEVSQNFTDILNQVTKNGGLDAIKGNANNLLSSANDVAKAVNQILIFVNDLFVEIKPDIVAASHELSQTCANLNVTSQKINTAIDEEYIKNSLYHLKGTTQNFEGTSQLLNTQTIPILNSALCTLKNLLDNVNTIIKGVGKTLSKRMGGAKIIFGKAIEVCED